MILDGKEIANQIQEELKAAIQKNLKKRRPSLAVILVGKNPPSVIYVNRKVEACQKVGIDSIKKEFSENISESQLLKELDLLNQDSQVDGILVQLPLPSHINPMTIISAINPNKDVDGLHPINAGKLLLGNKEGFVPCTPLGIKTILERSQINTSGKEVVILGRSNLVGKPTAALLMQNDEGANATVTIAHSHTKNIEKITKNADILIAAIGKPQFVKESMVKEGVVVIDVGINKMGNHIVGDVDFENVKNKSSFITPVPGGVGPMTIAMLLSNTYKSFLKCVF